MSTDLRKPVPLVLAAALCLAGCRSGLPPNSNPSCTPCKKFLPKANEATCGEVDRVPMVAEGETWENLVFQGGGVKGAAYAGALTAFGDERLEHVERVAGTSAGAITAMIVSLGYDAEEICHTVSGIDFSQQTDGGLFGPIRLFTRYGFFKGDHALCLLECLVWKKTGNHKTTFRELHERTAEPSAKFKDLVVFGTDVNTQRARAFSHEKTGDLAIADAARISMSIPFFFAARQFADDVFVDGGVLINYPIKAFDKVEGETLGFVLGGEPERASIDGLGEFTKGVVATVLNQQVDQLCRDTYDVRRSVFIDTLGISAFDFGLEGKRKRELILSGWKHAEAYLQGHRPDECPVFVHAGRVPALEDVGM